MLVSIQPWTNESWSDTRKTMEGIMSTSLQPMEACTILLGDNVAPTTILPAPASGRVHPSEVSGSTSALGY